jgi:hypothetical protein
MHNEYFFIQQALIQNNISHEKTEQWPTFPHSHPDGTGICHNMLPVEECLPHRILCFVNRTTAKQLLALLHQFGICDLQDASSED